MLLTNILHDINNIKNKAEIMKIIDKKTTNVYETYAIKYISAQNNAAIWDTITQYIAYDTKTPSKSSFMGFVYENIRLV
jgi:hypothetical protein